MKEPELEEEALDLSAQDGDLIVERRTIEDAAPPVTLAFPDGGEQEVTLSETAPGHFTARIADAPRGLYRATSGDLFAIGVIGVEAAPEFQNVVSTSAQLAPLAEETGGGVFRIRRDDGADLPELRRLRRGTTPRAGENWAGVLERGAARVQNVKDAPLAPALFWLVILALSLLAAWAIEGGRLPRRPKQG
jgi:hypothetical protein